MSEIRRALGDNANSPLFIRTVHGFGYSFICQEHDAPAVDDRSARRVRGWLICEQDRLPIFDGENVFGRGDSNVTDLPSSTVSRRHARIRVDDEVWLEDLGSKNGTFLKDKKVTHEVQLADGDRVRFGSLLVTFRLTRDSDITRTQSTAEIPIREN